MNNSESVRDAALIKSSSPFLTEDSWMSHFHEIRNKKQCLQQRVRVADSTRAKMWGLARVLDELNTYDIECSHNFLLKYYH